MKSFAKTVPTKKYRIIAGGRLLGLLVLLMLPVLSSCQTAAVHKDDAEMVTLTRQDGTLLRVPLTGSQRYEKAEAIAGEIQRLDQIIALRRASVQSEADSAIIAVASECRNDALKELELALRIAQETSAGLLDEKILGKARQFSVAARETVKNPVPANIMVATNISTSVQDATLHYMSKGAYDVRSPSWASYTEGDRLRIGRYVFRVQPLKALSDVYDEVVLVISDPTKRVITPLSEVHR